MAIPACRRNIGRRCDTSPAAESSGIATEAWPPFTLTRWIGAPFASSCSYMISSSDIQVIAAATPGTEVIKETSPPAIGTRCSVRSP